MSDLKAIVVGLKDSIDLASVGHRRFVEYYFSFRHFATNAHLDQITAGKQVAVFELPSYPLMVEPSIQALRKLRTVSDMPAVCIANTPPSGEVIQQLGLQKAHYVVGNYSLTRSWGRQGIAAALRATQFQWKAPENAEPSPLPAGLPEIEMMVDVVGNRSRGGTVEVEGRSVHFEPWHVKFLSHLSGGDFHGRENLFDCMYSGEPIEDRPEAKIIDVQISKMSKHLDDAHLPPIMKFWGLGRRWPAILRITPRTASSTVFAPA